MFHKMLEKAEAGDQMGVLLKGMKKDEIRRGQVLCAAGTQNIYNSFKAQVSAAGTQNIYNSFKAQVSAARTGALSLVLRLIKTV